MSTVQVKRNMEMEVGLVINFLLSGKMPQRTYPFSAVSAH